MSKYHVCGAVLCCGSCTPPHSGSSNAWAGETNIAKTPMNQPNLHDYLSYHWSCGQKSVTSRCCFNRAWYWVSHNAFFGNPRHTQSTIVYMILSISGNLVNNCIVRMLLTCPSNRLISNYAKTCYNYPLLFVGAPQGFLGFYWFLSKLHSFL